MDWEGSIWDWQTRLEEGHIKNDESEIVDFVVNFKNDEIITLNSSSNEVGNNISSWQIRQNSIQKIRDSKSFSFRGYFYYFTSTLRIYSSLEKLYLWNVKTQDLITINGKFEALEQVTFSPDSQTIAAIKDGKQIIVWAAFGIQISDFYSKDHVDFKRFHFSPDSNFIISVDQNNLIQIWDIEQGFISNLGTYGQVDRVIFSPDSNHILIYDSSNQIANLWQNDGMLFSQLSNFNPTENNNEYRFFVFSKDGEILLSYGKENLIEMRDIPGKTINRLHGHSSAVSHAAISPDSNFIVSTNREYSWDKQSLGNQIIIWDRNGEVVWNTEYQENQVHRSYLPPPKFSVPEFSPNSKFLIFIKDNSNVISLWNSQTNQEYSLLGHYDAVSDIVFSPDSNWMLSSSDDGTIRLWNLSDFSSKVVKEYQGSTYSLKMLFEDNNKFWTVDTYREEEYSKQDLQLWNLEGINLKTRSFTDTTIHFNFSQDDKIINLLEKHNDTSQTVKLLDNQADNIATLEITKKHQIDFSPNGRAIAITESQKSLQILDLKGEEIATINEPLSSEEVIAFSPNSDAVASGHENGLIKLWKIDGMFTHGFKNHTSDIELLAFSSDGDLLASVDQDSSIILQDWNGNVKDELKLENKNIEDIYFSPDGLYLVITYDNLLGIWSLLNGFPLTDKPQEEFNVSYGHRKSFTRDGEIMAVSPSPRDSRLQLFMIKHIWFRESELNLLSVDNPATRGYVISPQGDQILGISEKGIRSWSLDLDELLKLGCEHVNDYLKHNPNVKESDRKLCDDILK